MALRFRLASVCISLAIAIGCGGSVAGGPPDSGKKVDPVTEAAAPAVASATVSQTDPGSNPGTVLDDAVITEFYREVSPSGPIGDANRDSLDSALLPDSIQPIYTPKFVTADQASFLLPEELVMGVDLDGEARAYPVGLMRFREMVNDTLGGVPILVTW